MAETTNTRFKQVQKEIVTNELALAKKAGDIFNDPAVAKLLEECEALVSEYNGEVDDASPVLDNLKRTTNMVRNSKTLFVNQVGILQNKLDAFD